MIRKCIEFKFSGVGGNSNNFDSCHDCILRCFSVSYQETISFQIKNVYFIDTEEL